MNKRKRGIFIGSIIILIGIFSFLANFQVFGSLKDYAGAGILLLFAYLFFSIYSDSRKWWALFVTIVFAFLGLLVLFDLWFAFPDDIPCAFLLFLAAGVFVYLYAKNEAKWWAIIPAGVLCTLGTIVILDAFNLVRTDQEGVVFFTGSGLTFLYLTQIGAGARFRWAKYAGLILCLIAFFIFLETEAWLRTEFLIAAILIVSGVFLIYKVIAGKK